MDMTQSFLTGGKTHHHNNIRFRNPPRIVDFGSHPRFLEAIARGFQLNPRDEEEDICRVEAALKHIVQKRNLANVAVFLQEVGMAMEQHGYGSAFSRTVKSLFHKVHVLRFQDAVFAFLPELGKVP